MKAEGIVDREKLNAVVKFAGNIEHKLASVEHKVNSNWPKKIDNLENRIFNKIHNWEEITSTDKANQGKLAQFELLVDELQNKFTVGGFETGKELDERFERLNTAMHERLLELTGEGNIVAKFEQLHKSLLEKFTEIYGQKCDVSKNSSTTVCASISRNWILV
nr:uncharacterized protein LOC117217539 [Megalopta genalis]